MNSAPIALGKAAFRLSLRPRYALQLARRHNLLCIDERGSKIVDLEALAQARRLEILTSKERRTAHEELYY